MTVHFDKYTIQGGASTFFGLDPRATYLTAPAGATDAVAISLGTLGLRADDIIGFQVYGDFDDGSGSDESAGLNAVFSGSNVLRPSNTAVRVRDAIATTLTDPGAVTGPTKDGTASDIVQDFDAGNAAMLVPAGAKYAFFSTPDYSNPSDNSDPDHDFGVLVLKPTLIGTYHNGALTIDGGGEFRADELFLGTDVACGTVTVSGAGSKLSVGGNLLGDGSKRTTDGYLDVYRGTLQVSDGGSVLLSSNSDYDGYNLVMTVESQTYPSSVISGAHSSLITSGSDDAIVVGYGGTGELDVLGGGLLRTQHMVVGAFGNRYEGGIVRVSGKGASLGTEGEGNSIELGGGSTGTLSVEKGSMVKTANLVVGFGKEGNGDAYVSGAGSSWDVVGEGPQGEGAGFLLLGQDTGHGSLHVVDGGSFRVVATTPESTPMWRAPVLPRPRWRGWGRWIAP